MKKYANENMMDEVMTQFALGAISTIFIQTPNSMKGSCGPLSLDNLHGFPELVEDFVFTG